MYEKHMKKIKWGAAFWGIVLLSIISENATYILQKPAHSYMQKSILEMFAIIRGSKVWQMLSHLQFNKLIAPGSCNQASVGF